MWEPWPLKHNASQPPTARPAVGMSGGSMETKLIEYDVQRWNIRPGALSDRELAGPLALGQQVLYKRIVAHAGRQLGSRYLGSAGATRVCGGAGSAVGIAGLLAGNNLIIILRPAAAVIAPAGFFFFLIFLLTPKK